MRDEECLPPPEGRQQPLAVAGGPTDLSLKIVLLRSAFAAFGSAGPVPANALVKSAPGYVACRRLRNIHRSQLSTKYTFRTE